jgi:hypothetical protein
MNWEKNITEGGRIYSEFSVELLLNRETLEEWTQLQLNSYPKIDKNEHILFEYRKYSTISVNILT